jgi:RNA polymerase sigma-70 factor (sigma-E family)
MPTFSECYSALYGGLVRLAYATTMSTALAEEIVQDAFTSAYQSWDRIDVPESWLRRAVLNRSVSWLRRHLVERRLESSVREEARDATELDTQVLVQALRKLPPSQRAVVYLKYYEDLSEQQMAELLGCPVGTVKSRLNRARTVLRRELA